MRIEERDLPSLFWYRRIEYLYKWAFVYTLWSDLFLTQIEQHTFNDWVCVSCECGKFFLFLWVRAINWVTVTIIPNISHRLTMLNYKMRRVTKQTWWGWAHGGEVILLWARRFPVVLVLVKPRHRSEVLVPWKTCLTRRLVAAWLGGSSTKSRRRQTSTGETLSKIIGLVNSKFIMVLDI